MTPNPGQAGSTYEEHRRAWEELAQGIAALRGAVSDRAEAGIVPGARPGELTVIGSGIETVGFSLGDERLIRDADKVLYCVADPATIVWIRRLRPDALDLYVLYGDDKIRYTTYMQMTEAQLYWVRQGLNVVVIFYGHPGIFVLSTHRAVAIARREGFRAVMKAGVSALDTLCADLGVDPSHPGLQTFEATDCLTRRRRIDTTLHVVLWQVGLIGELGYRRQGYVNANFSYFINWLQTVYGADYEVVHYIGSRYPTVDPLVERQPLSALHDPAVQARVTGLSTFYIPPRDVVPTDHRTAVDLGLLADGQRLVTPASPLREIDRYGPREAEAFRAFANFAIPSSYRWQEDTAASDFLIALRLDPTLQRLYRSDPAAALADPRFAHLSDRERGLLASRDSGSIQVAAKGAFRRSTANERLLDRLLNSRPLCAALLGRIAGRSRTEARRAVESWLGEQGLEADPVLFQTSIDFIYTNTLYPWTGVYLAERERRVVALLGNRTSRARSALYVDGCHIPGFRLENGTIGWRAGPTVPFHGVLKLDLTPAGRRRFFGKCWADGETPGEAQTFVAEEADPGRAEIAPVLTAFRGSDDRQRLLGDYAIRSNGRFARETATLTIAGDAVLLDGQALPEARVAGDRLSWSGGARDWYAGTVTFLPDPIAGSVELFGECRSREEATVLKCHGARRLDGPPAYRGSMLPDWAGERLARVVAERSGKGGLLLWHKWEKSNFTNLVVNAHLAPCI